MPRFCGKIEGMFQLDGCVEAKDLAEAKQKMLEIGLDDIDKCATTGEVFILEGPFEVDDDEPDSEGRKRPSVMSPNSPFNRRK